MPDKEIVKVNRIFKKGALSVDRIGTIEVWKARTPSFTIRMVSAGIVSEMAFILKEREDIEKWADLFRDAANMLEGELL